MNRIRRDAKTARLLAATLAPDNPDIASAAARHADGNARELQRHAANGAWPDDLSQDGVWSRTIDLLIDAGRFAVINRKSDADDLKEALDPMLSRRGVAFDWRFVDELEREVRLGELEIHALLELVGERVAQRGLVLASVGGTSGEYTLAICTPEDFGKIDRLCDSDGQIDVSRF